MTQRHLALSALSDLTYYYQSWHAEGLRGIGLTPVRARALYGLYSHGPQRQHALSSLAGCSPQQMNGILEALEGRGYIVRNPDPSDGRATQISLTSEGWALASIVETLRKDAIEELFGDLDPQAVETFTHIANTVIQRINESEMTVESARERTVPGARV